MFWNNVKIALRNLKKNKVFAAINIIGLAIGLTIYVLGGLLTEYEETHDLFFENASRTYTIGSKAAPGLDMAVDDFDSTFSAVGPVIEAELSDVDAVARTLLGEYLVSVGEESFYEGVRFADPELLDIFDFRYIAGDASALRDPSGLLINESTAIKYFGRSDVAGKVITFDNEFDFHVTAVIEDVPKNSHFTSSVVNDVHLNFLLPMEGLKRMRDIDLAGNWTNLSIANLTYVMVPPALGEDWLNTQVDGIFERHVPDEQKEVISDLTVRPLVKANLAFWDMIGMPIIAVIGLLSLLVLIVACVNYTNLATAQSLGRSREVGMRKTMGASQAQLLTQFLVESLVIAAVAMLVAIAALEIIIPLLNNAANKALTIDYIGTLPWLLATTLIVGVGAGLYPAWLITRASPIDALRDSARKGKKGSKMRAVMIGGQFAISAFMLAIVTIVFVQNERVKESSYIFPRSEIYTIDRLQIDGVKERLDTLKNELEAIPNVHSVAFSSQVPFEQNNSTRQFSKQPGDEAGKFNLQYLSMTPEFFDAYDMPVLAGRNLDRDIANDISGNDDDVVNVVINEMTLGILGYATPQEAVNQRFYEVDNERGGLEYIIVGVVPTRNITGLFNKEKPWFFTYNPDNIRVGTVRITGGSIMSTVEEIEDAWNRVIPEYPIQGRFLDDIFDGVYNILAFMNVALAGFAFIALALALIGLFGLAAFMAAQRTKEIGMRKVLGASSMQIARLLVWQFSKPVMWALVLALPAAYFASQQYLNFFADRIEQPLPILAAAGAIAVMLAWGTVAGHALKIASANPILALRYE